MQSCAAVALTRYRATLLVEILVALAVLERTSFLGAIHIPPVSDLGETIAKQCGVKTFVDTGTFRGDAAKWGSPHFARVVTVEAIPETYESTKAACKGFTNIEFNLGDSGEFLKRFVPTLTEPALFWLDAHAGGGNFGDKDVCPLLAEIEAINQSPLPHYILIDDARAFVATCPPPFEADVWPSLDQIIPRLLARHPYHIVYINDALAAVPQSFKKTMQEFCIRVRPNI